MMWENNRVFVSVTKLKNPVKFVWEGIFVVLVESTGFEKKTNPTIFLSVWSVSIEKQINTVFYFWAICLIYVSLDLLMLGTFTLKRCNLIKKKKPNQTLLTFL